MRDTCYHALNELRRLVGLKGEGEVLFAKSGRMKQRGSSEVGGSHYRCRPEDLHSPARWGMPRSRRTYILFSPFSYLRIEKAPSPEVFVSALAAWLNKWFSNSIPPRFFWRNYCSRIPSLLPAFASLKNLLSASFSRNCIIKRCDGVRFLYLHAMT